MIYQKEEENNSHQVAIFVFTLTENRKSNLKRIKKSKMLSLLLGTGTENYYTVYRLIRKDLTILSSVIAKLLDLHCCESP